MVKNKHISVEIWFYGAIYATWFQKYLNGVQKNSKPRNLHQMGSWNNNNFDKNIQESLKTHREYDDSI